MIHDNMKSPDSSHSNENSESALRLHRSLGEDNIETMMHHLVDDPLDAKHKLSRQKLKELRREWDQARTLSRRTRNSSKIMGRNGLVRAANMAPSDVGIEEAAPQQHGAEEPRNK